MAHIKKHLHYYMLLAIVAAIGNIHATGGFVTPRPFLVAYVVVLIIFPVLINARIIEVFRHFKEPRPLFCSLAINFIVSPAVAFLMARLFLASRPEAFAVLMLLSLVPTSAMSVAWTSFSKANTATALYLIPINILFAAMVALPFMFPFLAGGAVQIGVGAILTNLAIVFFIPLVLGDLTRRVIVRSRGAAFFDRRVKPMLGNVSALGILGLIFLVMSLPRNRMLLENGWLLLEIAVPVVLYYASMYTIATLWSVRLVKGGSLPGEKSVVLVYTSVARHINICIALLMATFSLEQIAPMMLCLILAYLVQVLSLALYAQKIGVRIAALTV